MGILKTPFTDYFTLLYFKFSAMRVCYYWSKENFNFKQKTV